MGKYYFEISFSSKFKNKITDENEILFLNLDGEYFKDVLFENNENFTIWKDPISIKPRWIIECENKPRNMPIFGIFWKELEEND